MDTLPQELVDRIVSYLEGNDLKSTLLLSRKFQYASEEKSGAFSEFNLTVENVAEFRSTYSGRRSRYLRELHFKTSVFPRDEDAEEECRDTEEELKAMDEDFTRQVKFLFNTLDNNEKDLADELHLGPIHLTIYEPTRATDEDYTCHHHMFVSWRVHLLSPSSLPKLDSVQTLTIKTPQLDIGADGPGKALRRLDFRAILDLAKKCPNLELLRCKLGGSEWQSKFQHEELQPVVRQFEGPRRDSRHQFAEGLEGLNEAVPFLRDVHLDFLFPLGEVDLIDQRAALPNLVSPAVYDPFSNSLRILSYQLRIMSLRIVADSTLFWPADGTTPYWPNLETISVMFHMSTPSGSWYFNGLPGVGATKGYELDPSDAYPPLATTDQDKADDDAADDYWYSWQQDRIICQYRVYPNEDTLIPFLMAFAKATAYIPKLKEFAVWCPLNVDTPHDEPAYADYNIKTVTSLHPSAELAWGIAYAAPGMKAFPISPGENHSSNRQIWWRVGHWRPTAEFHRLFQNIGHKDHGDELLEYWEDDHYGKGLSWRDNFESWEADRWDVDVE